jgi:hypothetical protein
MWEFIKNKLGKLGCFAVIALMMIAAVAITKLVLGWFQYDEARKQVLSSQVGEYVGKGLLGLAVVLGFILMARQLVAELRARRGAPPPLPPPPAPRDDRGSRGDEES